MNSTPEILFDRQGAAGVVTLNRPDVLNAVTHNMVRALAAQLDEWKTNSSVTRVVIRANGERAFSAGGDLREVTKQGPRGNLDEALVFFRNEYLLNTAIKRYPKPYVALIDGIVMGGGVGVSIHGSHRVAGDKFQFAMPEVGIGFFPDVGGTWFLPRLNGETGTFCALTGERLKAADAVRAGIANYRVSSNRFPELLDALCGNVSVDAILAAFAENVGEGEVQARLTTVGRAFAGKSVEEIRAKLSQAAKTDGEDGKWAMKITKTMEAKSPTSLRIALEQMRRGKNWTFEECMKVEFRIVSRVLGEPDFYEGVRAVIVDKDNLPKWQPATLAETSPQSVEKYFAPLPEELPV